MNCLCSLSNNWCHNLTIIWRSPPAFLYRQRLSDYLLLPELKEFYTEQEPFWPQNTCIYSLHMSLSNCEQLRVFETLHVSFPTDNAKVCANRIEAACLRTDLQSPNNWFMSFQCLGFRIIIIILTPNFDCVVIAGADESVRIGPNNELHILCMTFEHAGAGELIRNLFKLPNPNIFVSGTWRNHSIVFLPGNTLNFIIMSLQTAHVLIQPFSEHIDWDCSIEGGHRYVIACIAKPHTPQSFCVISFNCLLCYARAYEFLKLVSLQDSIYGQFFWWTNRSKKLARVVPLLNAWYQSSPQTVYFESMLSRDFITVD